MWPQKEPKKPSHCDSFLFLCPQIVSSASTDLQDYTYYFVPAPWLSVKLLRLLQCYPPPGPAGPIWSGGWAVVQVPGV